MKLSQVEITSASIHVTQYIRVKKRNKAAKKIAAILQYNISYIKATFHILEKIFSYKLYSIYTTLVLHVSFEIQVRKNNLFPFFTQSENFATFMVLTISDLKQSLVSLFSHLDYYGLVSYSAFPVWPLKHAARRSQDSNQWSFPITTRPDLPPELQPLWIRFPHSLLLF